MKLCIYLSTAVHLQSGSFSSDGITQIKRNNRTFVQCTSNHLTSFAVLVDASGVSLSVVCWTVFERILTVGLLYGGMYTYMYIMHICDSKLVVLS